jgi:integrase
VLKDFKLGCLFLLLFHGLLRVSEGLLRKASDFSFSNGICVVNLGYTKSGKRRGETESMVLSDPIVLEWVSSLLNDLEPGDRLFAWSYTQFASLLVEVFETLKLQNAGFKTHSFRRGGATHLFRKTSSYDKVMEHGRWESLKPCRLYVNEAISALTEHAFSFESRRRMLKYGEIALDSLCM